MPTTWEDDKAQGFAGRLRAAERGENPTVVTRLPSGLVVLGDTQFLPGYCVLIAVPLVESLGALPPEAQQAFLLDMARLGGVIQQVTGCARINYGIYGNSDPYLHAHVWARYAWEPDERRAHPAWLYPPDVRNAREVQFDPQQHGELRRRLAAGLMGREEPGTSQKGQQALAPAPPG